MVLRNIYLVGEVRGLYGEGVVRVGIKARGAVQQAE
jgi:hypothetical protein